MKVIHISAECYPVAKVGGLADVVGALPKYLNVLDVEATVIMPFYDNAFTSKHSFHSVFKGHLFLDREYSFQILELDNDSLDFPILFVDVPDLLFRDYVYSHDDTERFLAFQIAALDYMSQLKKLPDIVHCHDHHTGLIPFMMSQSHQYKKLKDIPTILTIHNAQYQGWFSHDMVYLIPPFDFKNVGLLDWNHMINPLATGIKCAWKVTTVSPNYMEELKQNANGLESLLQHEAEKCSGILNGIDADVWNPETDPFLVKNYSVKTNKSGKKANKKWLCEEFGLNPEKPLVAFIGRLVGEKGADLFGQLFYQALSQIDISLLMLGSGDKGIENALEGLKPLFKGRYNTFIGYNEKLSHVIYAGADFLLMPSRVEPCGLNQMYALRYGTVPIVNRVGGLQDTVIDISEEKGFGICTPWLSVENVVFALKRARNLFEDTDFIEKNTKLIMQIDHSWNHSAKTYIDLYKTLKS